MMPSRIVVAAAFAWMLTPSISFAADPVPPVPPVWQSNDAAWFERYTFARERLLAGDFTQARELFAELARGAHSAADAALAGEMANLAGQWAQRDVAFVRRADLGESQLSAKAAGERTTDEIAVLYTNAVFYGLGSGVWFDVLSEPSSTAGGILPALGFAGAAAGAVALIDSSRPLKYGVPQSIVSGMYVGLEEGLAWTLWNQARSYRVEEWSGKGVASVIWGGATVGAIAGGVIGTVQGTTPGRASFVGSAALWTGLVSGLLAGAASQVEDTRDDHAMLASAIGVSAGAIAGAFAAGAVSPSIARVRFLDLGGIAGGLVVGGLYLAAADRNPSTAALMGTTAIGTAVGLGTAWFATQGMPADRIADGETKATALATSIVPTTGGAMLSIGGNL
jgi:hypothetical protein